MSCEHLVSSLVFAAETQGRSHRVARIGNLHILMGDGGTAAGFLRATAARQARRKRNALPCEFLRRTEMALALSASRQTGLSTLSTSVIIVCSPLAPAGCGRTNSAIWSCPFVSQARTATWNFPRCGGRQV